MNPGWGLLDFLLSIGAEFAVRVIYAGDDASDECERLAGKLAFASLGERTRECTVTYGGESNPRPVEVWRLDRRSLEALREVMPDGVLGSREMRSAWAEDLCVYRRGDLVFGTDTHERFAFLRLSAEEWRQWEGQSTGG